MRRWISKTPGCKGGWVRKWKLHKRLSRVTEEYHQEKGECTGHESSINYSTNDNKPKFTPECTLHMADVKIHI